MSAKPKDYMITIKFNCDSDGNKTWRLGTIVATVSKTGTGNAKVVTARCECGCGHKESIDWNEKGDLPIEKSILLVMLNSKVAAESRKRSC